MSKAMKVIFLDIPMDEMILAIRAVKWLVVNQDKHEGLMAYGEGPGTRTFYVRRNKASITVRPA